MKTRQRLNGDITLTRRLIQRFCLLGIGLAVVGGLMASGIAAIASASLELTAAPVQAIAWSQSAQPYQGQMGDVVLYCPPNGHLGQVWGSDMYADDSSICTAAVHGGLITVDEGGAIAIRLRPERVSYGATTQNDVTSIARQNGGGGFTFTTLHDPIPGIVRVQGESVPIQVASWQTTATMFRDRQREAIAFFCPPNGAVATVWGTKRYRSQSSVCSAAVHDGHIMPRQGGTVAIRMLSGQSRYRGSTQYAIASQDFSSQNGGESSASFKFVSFE